MAWFNKQARARRRIDVLQYPQADRKYGENLGQPLAPVDVEHSTRSTPNQSSHFVSGREALAASVEEVTAQNDELWDEDDEQLAQDGKASIIPPLLRLQSRVMPAVQAEQVERKWALPENNSRSAEQATVAGGPRLAGRSTRVHLQAVRPDATRALGTEHLRVMETAPSGEQGESRQRARGSRGTNTQVEPAAWPEQQKIATLAHSSPPLMGGRGVLKPGQKDATVANPHISERSVVMVMLTDNPGPVVVQYVSLYPRRGFTFHLSAPATAQTSFNYVIWSF